jgi:heme-degrading monooxygenase HmoA
VFARATTLEGPADRVDEGIRNYGDALSEFRSMPGNKGAFLLIDRGSGRAVGVTLWESRQAMQESQDRAQELRTQAAEAVSAAVKSVDEYEVAVWDVDAA